MNKSEVYKKLRSVKGMFTWKINSRKHIRGIDANGVSHCPITAIAKATTGKRYLITNWDNVAQDLDIDIDVACDIVDASDDPSQEHERMLIMKAVGLK